MCLCVVLVSKSEVFFFALLKIMTGGPRNNCRLSEIQYETAGKCGDCLLDNNALSLKKIKADEINWHLISFCLSVD